MTREILISEVGPRDDGVAAGDGWVWVVASLDWTVARIDAESERVVATIRTGPIPDELAIGGGSVWVSVHA